MKVISVNFLSISGKESRAHSATFAPMQLHGHNFIGYRTSAQADLGAATRLAKSAFPLYSALHPEQKAAFLEAIAEEIMLLGDALIERCVNESGLPTARITCERGRTCGQLKLFAHHLREGSWVEARIDTALPERSPVPRPDIRRMLIPIGPVAVFGASNFPLAFSTAGGDTASALAAGCPVIVKAHPSHTGTHEMIATAVIKAALRTRMPEGVFSALYLPNEEAIALVQDPAIQAVAFTGSRRVGLTLLKAARERAQPIPVFAEMSAVNPLVILEGALRDQADTIARGLASSVTLGVGQFCTNPGLVLLVDSPSVSPFLHAFATQLSAVASGTMLNQGIHQSYREGIKALLASNGVTEIARGISAASRQATVAHAAAGGDEPSQGQPFAFTVGGEQFLSDKQLSEEVFGPSTLVVRCASESQLLQVLQSLEGQLTATVHATDADGLLLGPVASILVQKAGRVIYGGYPTGVEVSDAMQHGGPFPSTSDPRTTSVGTAAILRFVRPVAYQDFPPALLPDELKNENPFGIMRLVNGALTREKI